ncbi:MAG: hypothetical protein ACRERV_14465, partial [Methylococcales bacterium]
MRFLAAYIMRGRMQAIGIATAFLFLSFLLPPLNIISAATIVLITLRQGPRDGLVTIFGAALGVAVLGLILINSPGFATTFALLFWFPFWIFSLLLRQSGQFGLTFEVALGLSLLAIAGVYLFISDPASAWRENLALVLDRLIENPPPGIDREQMKALIEPSSHYLTGIFAAGSLASLVMGMLLG